MLSNDISPRTDGSVDRIGFDGIAVKPTETNLDDIDSVPVETLTIDYEGREAVPDRDTLSRLAAETSIRLTTPVRADGFDPLGDDSLLTAVPGGVSRVLVAGHPAYLSESERRRAVAPRLGAALEDAPDAWVGTESIERIATATGADQFELLSARTEREVRALRAAGFTGEIAVYAPTVLSDDTDVVLDAIGEYVARRPAVASQLPDDAATDASATGATRETLLSGVADFTLAGAEATVRDRIEALRSTGVTTVVGYPARGPEAFFDR